MAKQYKHIEFFEPGNPVQSYIDGLKLMVAEIDKAKKKSKEVATALKGAFPKQFTKAEDLKKYNEVQTKTNILKKEHKTLTEQETAVMKELERVEKATIRERAKHSTQVQKHNKLLAEEREKTRRRNRETQETAKINISAKGSYERLNLEMNRNIRMAQQMPARTKAEKAARDKLIKSIAVQDKELKRLDGQMGRSQRHVGRYQNALTGLRGTVVTLGAAFGATFGIIGAVRGIQSATSNMFEFEKSLTNVLTLLSAAERKKYKGFLEKGSLQLMKDYGFTVEDTNKALFDAVSAGVPVAEVFTFMNQSAILAIAGVTDLGTAVDGMTSIMNAYHLSMDQAERVSAAFFSAQVFGKTTVQELADNIGQIAPSARKLNVSFQEVLTTMALFTKQGINISDATTAIKGVLTALRKPGEKARQMFEDLEIGVGAVAIQEHGLFNIIEKVSKAGEKNADVVAEMIPNIRALTAIDALGTEALEELHRMLNIVNDDYGDNSAIMQAYHEQMKTLSVQWDIMKAKVTVATIQGIGNFTKFLKNNWGVIKAVTKVLVILTTAIITLKTAMWLKINTLRVYNKLLDATKVKAIGAAKGIRTMTKAIIKNPLGLFITLLTTVAVALFLFKKRTDEATESLENFNDELDRMEGEMLFTELVRGIEMTEDGAVKLTGSIEKLGTEIKLMTQAQLESVKAFLEGEIPQLARDMEDAGENTEAYNFALNEMTISLKMVNEELKRMKKAGEDATDDKQIKSYEELTKKISELETQLKKEVFAKNKASFATAIRLQDLRDEKQLIDDNIESLKIYIKALQELEGQDWQKIDMILPTDEEVKDYITEFQKRMAKGLRDIPERVPMEEDELGIEWEDYLGRLLGFEDPDKWARFKEFAREFIGQVTQLLDNMFRAQVDAAQRNLDFTNQTINDLENALNREQQARAAGSRNSVSLLEKQLQEEKLVRSKAQKEYEEAVRKQEAWDRVKAYSSIITASASIIAQWSDKSPVGWIIGLASAAIMIGLYEAMRASTKKGMGLFEGTESVEGKGAPDGKDTVSTMLTKKERVLTVEQNKPLLKMGVKNKDISGYVQLGMMAMASPVNNSVNNYMNHSIDTASLQLLSEKTLIENQKTNELLAKWRFIEHRNNQRIISDLNGNMKVYV